MTRFHCYAIIKMKGWHGGVSEGVIKEEKAREKICFLRRILEEKAEGSTVLARVSPPS